MPLQYSTVLRNNQMAQIEATIGASPRMELRSGPPPANCEAADVGTLLATIILPSDWLLPPQSGAVAINNGPWSTTGSAAGLIGHFRLKTSTGLVCHAQGTVAQIGGSADMIVDNTNIALGQSVSISTFSVASGNA